MLTEIIGFLDGGVLSSLVGGITGYISKYYTMKLEMEHEKAKWNYEREMHALQIEADKIAFEQGLMIEQTRGEWGAFRDSIKADKAITEKGGMSRWVTDFRAAFRPGMTSGLWLAVIAIALWGPVRPGPLMITITETLLNTASMASGWWFGGRYASKRP